MPEEGMSVRQYCRKYISIGLGWGEWGFHPPAVRRKTPHNQRVRQSIPSARKSASGLADGAETFEKRDLKPNFVIPAKAGI
jgi:hypothetical protein